MSISRWMDKDDAVHISSGILPSHKKEWNHAICSNVNGHRYYYPKWSKSEKPYHTILYGITYSERKWKSVVPASLQPHGLNSPWNSPGQNIRMGSHFLLQGIFLTQGSNLGLPHCRQILYHLSTREAPLRVNTMLNVLCIALYLI